MRITWADLTFPALNLWNYPSWLHHSAATEKVSKPTTFIRRKVDIHGVSVVVMERKIGEMI